MVLKKNQFFVFLRWKFIVLWNKNEILIQSRYTVDDFKYRNPSWELPKSSSIDENGYLRVWYSDGTDDNDDSSQQFDADNYFSVPINRINN